MTARAMSSSCRARSGPGRLSKNGVSTIPGSIRVTRMRVVLVHRAQLLAQRLADRGHRPLGRRVERAGQRAAAGDRARDQVVAVVALEQVGQGRADREATPSTLVSTIDRQCSGDSSRKPRVAPKPALAKTASMPPKASIAAAARRSLSAHSVTSQRHRDRALRAAELVGELARACPRCGRRARAGSRRSAAARARGGADPARGAGDQEDGVVGHRHAVKLPGADRHNPGRQMDPDRKRKIRLVVALGAAVLLAAALVYTSFSASSEARSPPSLARGQRRQLRPHRRGRRRASVEHKGERLRFEVADRDDPSATSRSSTPARSRTRSARAAR